VAAVQVPAGQARPKVVGRYEIIDTIGKGAMGVVYKARDPALDRVVAIKTIVAPPRLGRGVRKSYLERFDREAKAAARIAHPAIVTIYDIGVEEESPFLVMEYLPGETLADRLDRVRLPMAQAVQCARDLASALGAAHKERLVHRDVKPANVLHAGENRWKLADFGIVRVPDSELTQVGIFMGTPGYAPPEAIRDGVYTAQADVFAWGAVLYELLSGKVPYEGPDTHTTNGYVMRAEAPSPRLIEPGLPEPQAQVALRALAHDTKKRYATGTEAEAALAEAWETCIQQNLLPMSAFATASSQPGRTSGQQALTPPPPPALHAVPAPVVTPPPAAVSPPKTPAKPVAQRSGNTDVPTTLFRTGEDAAPLVPARSAVDNVATLNDAEPPQVEVGRPIVPPAPARVVAVGALRPRRSAGGNARFWLVALLLLAIVAGLAAIFLRP
jgi:serine/threonine-protein kinase